MPTIVISIVCPHCGSQMSHKVNDSATQNVTCQSGRGGCGKSARISLSRGMLNWVKKG